MSQHEKSPERDYEFERRFLVEDISILKDVHGDRVEQGYLWAREGYVVRVRLTWAEDGDEPIAFFTLKGPRIGEGMRFEREQDIPLPHARALYELSTFRVSKMRYAVISEGRPWVVDVFEGDNDGLIIAEFEASAAEVATVRPPWWCSREITPERRYDNESLAREPYKSWQEQ